MFTWVLDLIVYTSAMIVVFVLLFYRHICVFPTVWWKLFLRAAVSNVPVSVRHSLCESILCGQQDCVFDDEKQVASWNNSLLWVYESTALKGTVHYYQGPFWRFCYIILLDRSLKYLFLIGQSQHSKVCYSQITTAQTDNPYV